MRLRLGQPVQIYPRFGQQPALFHLSETFAVHLQRVKADMIVDRRRQVMRSRAGRGGLTKAEMGLSGTRRAFLERGLSLVRRRPIRVHGLGMLDNLVPELQLVRADVSRFSGRHAQPSGTGDDAGHRHMVLFGVIRRWRRVASSGCPNPSPARRSRNLSDVSLRSDCLRRSHRPCRGQRSSIHRHSAW